MAAINRTYRCHGVMFRPILFFVYAEGDPIQVTAIARKHVSIFNYKY